MERRAGGREHDARRAVCGDATDAAGRQEGIVAQLSVVRACRVLSERGWHREGHPEQEVGAWQ